MSTTSQQKRAFTGPVIFSHGFRSFFLLAGLWAAGAMTIWLFTLIYGYEIPSRLSASEWHLHEMVFGYSSAVITGFLLTAVPNWTGRMPIIGWPMAAFAGLWVAGRLAVFTSGYLNPYLASAIDLAFLFTLGLIIAREIISGKSRRNLKVLALVISLFIANLIFHIEAQTGGAISGYGVRLGVGTVILLVTLIGGRVIPSFTNNWLARSGMERLPKQIKWMDEVGNVSTMLTMAAWVAMPENLIVRLLSLATGIILLVRMSRWAGWRSLKEPLVTVLHAGYFFIPVGFLTLALADILPGRDGSTQIPHAWMVGAIGIMTLAMMTRASLGHSGRALTATWSITAIYISAVITAFVRVAAEVWPDEIWLLNISGIGWILTFSIYVVVYFPILTKRRI